MYIRAPSIFGEGVTRWVAAQGTKSEEDDEDEDPSSLLTTSAWTGIRFNLGVSEVH